MKNKRPVLNRSWSRARKTAMVTGLSSVIALTSCGKSSSSTAESGDSLASAISGLDSIPSTSTLVKENESSSSRLALEGGGSHSRAFSSRAVVGTPPLITELKASYDQYFWNGIIATINATNVNAVTSSMRNQFWGQLDGGAGGQSACMMASRVGESIGRMLQSGTTACYMRNLPKAASGVTITGSKPSKTFAQSDADKLVRVNISNMSGGGGGGSPTVFIKVYGSNSVTGNVYKMDMYMCNSGSVTSNESMEINKVTGKYTQTSMESQGGSDYGLSSVTAYLKLGSGGVVEFDAGQDRNVDAHYSGTWGKFKSSMTITSENIILNRSRNDSTWGASKEYSKSRFGGANFKDLRFYEAATKGYFDDGSNNNTYSGAVEWHSTFYANNASHAYKPEVDAMNFASDDFYSGTLAAPSVSLTGDCSAAGDVQVSMDFADSAVAAIQTQCEGERFSDYDMCNSSSVQTAQTKVFQSWNNGL